jgi:hypothetical protein
MSVPFTRGLGGRQGARAVNKQPSDLGDLVSVLVVGLVGVACKQAVRPTDRSRSVAVRPALAPRSAEPLPGQAADGQQ